MTTTLEITQLAMQRAAAESDRSAEAIRLIAVSKEQPIERIEAVLQRGHRCFGENKVQAAAAKWPALQESYGKVDLHLLGPLQTNKVRQAMQLFDAIHSVDRLKLVNSIARIANELGRCPDLFIQVNTGEEPQKAGVIPSALPALIDAAQSVNLPVIGLMCIPPQDEEPSLHFALLAKMAAQYGLPRLSMGMSADFERAIKQGATDIRVGSALFGARPPRPEAQLQQQQ